ncbi:MAG: dihydrofolate reductase family protein [Thermoleophilaceae bacterium]
MAIGGGANVAQQYLAAGLLDEMQIHVAPVLLGGGVRLFEDHLSVAPAELECTRVIESPSGVAHLAYRRRT